MEEKKTQKVLATNDDLLAAAAESDILASQTASARPRDVLQWSDTALSVRLTRDFLPF